MDKRHAIDEAVFDISFDSARAEREQQAGLAAFIRDRLLPLAEEIFDELAADGTVSKIDSLELDLGDIDYDGFQDEMSERFRTQLKSVLQDKIRSLSSSPSAGTVLTRQQAEFDVLLRFLESGRLSGHAGRAAKEAGERMLLRAMATGGKELAGYLRDAPGREIAVKRLARHFTGPALGELVRHIAPAHADDWEALVHGFVARHGKNRQGMTAKELSILLWEELIHALLESGDRHAAPGRLLDEIGERIFDREPGAPDREAQRRHHAQTHAKKLRVQEAPESGMRDAGTGHSPFELPSPGPSAMELSDSRLLAARLESALANGQAEEVVGIWAELKPGHADVVEEICRRLLADERTRAKIAQGFPQAVLLDLVRTAFPQESMFIEMLVGQPGLQQLAVAQPMRAVLWEHILGSLHGGLDYRAFAIELVPRLTSLGVERNEVRQAIAQAGRAAGVAVPEEAGETETTEEISLLPSGDGRGDMLARRLLQRIRAAQAGPEMSREIGELVGSYPQAFRQLWQQLQAARYPPDMAGLAAGELQQLLAGAVGLGAGGKAGSFAREIEKHAQEAPDRRSYYRCILGKLLGNRSVDLEEAVAAGSQSGAGRWFAAGTAGTPDHAPARRELLRACLQAALVQGRVEGLAGIWNELQLEHGDIVREVFMLRMGEPQARERLAAGFPESMLHDLVRLVAPRDGGFVVSLVEELALRAASHATGGKVSIRSALWEYALACLHASGAAEFERKEFGRGLLRRLLELDLAARPAVLPEVPGEGRRQAAGAAHDAEGPENLSAPIGAGQAGQLYQRVVRRLQGGRREAQQGIRELASGYPEMFRRLFRQLQAGELLAAMGNLTIGELHQLTSAIVSMNAGGTGSDFYAEIEKYAQWASNEKAYYCHVLERLVDNRIIDLEQAMAETFSPDVNFQNANVQNANFQNANFQNANFPDANFPDANAPDANAPDAEIIPSATRSPQPIAEPAHIAQLRSRLELALVMGDASGIAGIWDELHPGRDQAAREMLLRRVQDRQVREKLAANLPERRLPELAELLSPSAGAFVESFSRLPGFLNIGREGRRAFWHGALDYLYATGQGSFGQRDFASGLLRFMERRGTLPHPLLREIGELISPPPGKREEGDSQPVVRNDDWPASNREMGPLAEMAQAGAVTHKLVDDVRELAGLAPEMRRRRLREMRGDELAANLARLSLAEMRELVGILAGAEQPGAKSPLPGEIEELASQVQDPRGYYLYLLERLFGGQAVDFDEAARMFSPQKMLEGGTAEQIKTPDATSSRIELLRARLESALVQGKAEYLSGIWRELRQLHAGVVREVFMLRMNDATAMEKLVAGFPETMLFELVELLAPQESRYLRTLLEQCGQPETAGPGTGQTMTRDILWRYTLSYLVAAGADGLGRHDYEYGLSRELSALGLEVPALLRADDAGSPETEAAQAGLERQSAAVRAADEIDAGSQPQDGVASRADMLCRKLLRRLGGDVESDATRQIEELARDYPGALRDLLQELQAGKFATKVPGLTLPEVRQLVTLFVELITGGAGSELHCAIDTFAGEARNRQHYYQNILQRLIEGRVVDLEAALDAGMGGNEGYPHPDSGRAGTAATPGEALRSRLESALDQADAEMLAGLWDSLKSDHPQLLREVFGQAMAGEAGRKRLAEWLPESALLDLARLIVPQEIHLIEALSRMPELAGATNAGHDENAMRRVLREYTMTWLGNAGRNFERLQYASGLVNRLVQYGLPRAALVHAVAQADSAVGEALSKTTDASVDGKLAGASLPPETAANDACMNGAEPDAGLQTGSKRAAVQAVRNGAIASPDALPAPARNAGDEPGRDAILKARLESALVQGRPAEIGAVWGELCASHRELVREIFERRMGDAPTRRKVAEGFPESMLLDLLWLLSPPESRFIATLLEQPELQASAGPDMRAVLWEQIMGIIHASGGSLDRNGFIVELVRRLPDTGMDSSRLRQAIEHVTAESRESMTEKMAMAHVAAAGENRADMLARRMLRRLREPEPETGMPAEIGELASEYPETFGQLWRQLQTGEYPLEAGGLAANELAELVSGIVALNGGGRGSAFEREIERHAQRALDPGDYYRHILQRLLREQPVDLEEAMRARPGPGNPPMPLSGNRVPVQDQSPPPARAPAPSVRRQHDDKKEWEEEIYIANAGLVLATPYLPRLFSMLGLTGDAGFEDERSAERAVHLLQFAVNESCDSPEFLLVLNKILCGVQAGMPIVREIQASDQEREAVEGMLQAIIANWKVIGNTSPQGLRESFLQRAGRLRLREDGWHLEVEQKAIDVLLDRLPWSFSLVKYSWMRQPLYVEWR